MEALAGADLRERQAMQKLPQKLVNIRAADRSHLRAAMAAEPVQAAISTAAEELSGRGRVLVRASGTEPLRVIVDGVDVGATPWEGDLAPGPNILFAASGVTDGNMMSGVRFFGHGARTSSLVMALSEHLIRFIDTVHLDGSPDVVVEF